MHVRTESISTLLTSLFDSLVSRRPSDVPSPKLLKPTSDSLPPASEPPIGSNPSPLALMTTQPRRPRPTMTAAKLERWLMHARKGDSAVYHIGGNIAADRKASPQVEAVAEYALRHAKGDWPILSVCGHIRSHLIGSGELTLVQRRTKDGQTAYIAIKR